MPNEYDRIIKENIEAVILPLSAKLFGIRPEMMEEITVDLHLTLERKPDVTRRITSENRQASILHVEFQVGDETEMVLRMQTYRALLQEIYRLPVKQFVVYLGQKDPTMKTSIADLIVGDENNFRFELINIHQYDYERLLSSDVPEEILLAILGDFKNESPEAVVARILERLQSTSQNVSKLQRYVRQLVVMSKLRNLQENTLQNIEKMPFEFDIETDVFYRRGKEAGRKEVEAERERMEREKEAERERMEREKEAERERMEREKEAERERMEREKEAERERMEREKEEAVIRMLRDDVLRLEKIAAYAGVSVDYVKQLQQKLTS